MKYRRFITGAVICIMLCCSVCAADTDKAYITGEIKDGTYTNRAIGVEVHFDDNWRVLSMKEIAALDASALKSIENVSSPTLEELTNGDLPVLYVTTENFADTINITVTNIGAGVGDFLADPDSRAFLDGMMEDMAKSMREANSAMGVNSTVNTIRVNFAGAERAGLSIKTMVTETKPMYQKQIMCFKGEYLFQVTVNSKNRDITDELLAMFRKIDE